MIGSKIGNPKKSSSKAVRCASLIDYILNPENENSNEKCIYSGARGFITDDPQSQKAEMIALSQEAVRSKDTINHYVLSWREGEHPTAKQVEQSVDVLLEKLGLSEHQVVYGIHGDTDNIHLHIAINRVHPDTLKVIKPNKGFDKESVHQAIAVIEHLQGWQREKNGRYHVLENGALSREHINPNKQSRIPDHIKGMEIVTGEKSALRIAIENGADILKDANSWQELHQKLANVGMRYERKGSGAMVYVGDIGVKSSDVYRPASLPKLQKKLGPYEPPQSENENDRRKYFTHIAKPHTSDLDGIPKHNMHKLSERRLAHHGKGDTEGVLSLNARSYRRQPESVRREHSEGTGRQPEPIKKDVPGWDIYIAGRKFHYAEKNVETIEQRRRHDEERQLLSAQQKTQRDALFAGSWKGRGALLNAMRSILAAEQAAEKAELKERHKTEREQLREKYPPYPDFEQWLREQKHPEFANAWRYRASEPQHTNGDKTEPPTTRDIRAYKSEILGSQVHYTKKEDEGGGGVSFVDKGREIEIHDWRNSDSVLAALQLSAQKWGSFQVDGNDEYKAMCVRLAAEHGFNISNPELQDGIQKERQRIQQDRVDAMKSEQLRQFETYNNAVGAERYRVTSIKMREDGSKQTFILDKNDGVTLGFTAQEIEQRTPEMQRLQRRGENLYYTPLSNTKHHILIDDMSREKLDKLIKDGYKPAVVLESSPGNYQTIITVQKLGTAHDKDVGNRLSERLNQEYGDPKLSGCIHPHRAPGYENRKPKHKREDGSYPDVRLLKAERRECAMTLALSTQIDVEYQNHAEHKPKKQKPEQRPAGGVAVATGSAIDAYQRHHKDVLKRQQGGDIDLSRIDSMIAVRMRVTGHNEAEIEGALLQCAPGGRQDEGRNWSDYAQRTAKYAFGAAGDRQALNLGKYRQQWEKLEGRGDERDASVKKQMQLEIQKQIDTKKIKTIIEKDESDKSEEVRVEPPR